MLLHRKTSPEPEPSQDIPDREDIASSEVEEKKGLSVSFTKRIMLVSIAISLITVISSACLLSVVWEQHFQAYTRENVERVAEATASAIAQGYKQDGTWYGEALNAAAAASSLYDSVYIQVRNADGKIIYDDSEDEALGSVGVNEGGGNVASAAIRVDGEEIGTLLVHVPGAETLLTKFDENFRDNSYRAMVFAGVFAVVIAMVVGAFFSRKLVAPIKKITNAAKALKEGDYSARTGMEGNDEISRLGNMFDLMADSVEANQKLERRLVTDVAHELRTPLMAIQSTVEAMIDGVFEPDAERLETLNSEVQRLSRLVDALLKLSRLESRAKAIEKKKVDLAEMLSSVVLNHQAYIHDSGLNLEFQYDPHVYVYGDADLLRQAAANLISNAVRYTPEGGTITVKALKGDLMGQIVVKDTGIGLTAEEAKMVFQRFWRADSGRARATGGLGIGLSAVKEIVDQHNGWVRVEGRPNEGACFTIYIPLYNEEHRKRGQKRNQKKD